VIFFVSFALFVLFVLFVVPAFSGRRAHMRIA
jgi:hypothetical protein